MPRGESPQGRDSQVSSYRSATGDAGVVRSWIKSVIDPSTFAVPQQWHESGHDAPRMRCRVKVKREKNAEVRHRDTPIPGGKAGRNGRGSQLGYRATPS